MSATADGKHLTKFLFLAFKYLNGQFVDKYGVFRLA